MIQINGSNSSGVDLNKYVLKNVFNTVVNDLSDNVNKNKIDIEDIKNKVDAANDKFEWFPLLCIIFWCKKLHPTSSLRWNES